jgi:ubiquinone biosynthesis monooxygenase Coq6
MKYCNIIIYVRIGILLYKISNYQLLLNIPTGSGLVQIQLSDNEKNTTDSNKATTTTTIPKQIQTKLLIAADGVNSQIHQKSGITVRSHDYNQVALTFTVALQGSIPEVLGRRAFQRLLTTGPISLLPTWSDQHAVIVWSTTPSKAQHWKDNPKLVQHLNHLLQIGPELLQPLFHNDDSTSDYKLNNVLYGIDKVIETIQYGVAMAVQQGPMSAAASSGDPSCVFQAPPIITDIVSSQLSFPLKCQIASSHVVQQHQTRLALVGDAAHTVHPMAGQGLNLGLQDVDCLVKTIEKAVQSGMELTTFIGTEYETSRTTQVTATVNGIHALQNIFVGQQSTMAKHMKSIGMNFIQAAAPVRKLLVQAACQGVATSNTK